MTVDYATASASNMYRKINICCNKSLIIFIYKSRNNNSLAKQKQ